METISPILLRDTLNLIQLARETARLQGVNNQAQKLEPVVEQLKTLVDSGAEAVQGSTAAPSEGILGQSDFKYMLNSPNTGEKVNTSDEIVDRNRVVQAMSAGGMGVVDIARQLGISRGEVRTIISLNSASSVGWS